MFSVNIKYYLIQMIHKILTALDNNARWDIFAVVASLIDWKDAFPRQCRSWELKLLSEMGLGHQ